MNLYCWKSKYLESYTPGDIIVAAVSVEAARQVARLHFESHCSESVKAYNCTNPVKDSIVRNNTKKFESDIAVEPELISDNVLFLYGSD